MNLIWLGLGFSLLFQIFQFCSSLSIGSICSTGGTQDSCPPNSFCIQVVSTNYCACNEGYVASDDLSACFLTPAGYYSNAYIPSGATISTRPPYGPTSLKYDWNAIASSSNGNIVVACAVTQVPQYSWDAGVSWANSTLDVGSITGGWAGVAMSSDGKKIVAAQAATTSNLPLYLSFNYGLSYTSTNASFTGIVYAVACSASFDVIVLVSKTNGVMISTDAGSSFGSIGAVSYTNLGSPTAVAIGCNFDCSVIIVNPLDQTKMYFSLNKGGGWTSVEGPKRMSTKTTGIAVSADSKKAVAVTSDGKIYACGQYPCDFTVWKQVNTVTGNVYNTVCADQNLTTFITAGETTAGSQLPYSGTLVVGGGNKGQDVDVLSYNTITSLASFQQKYSGSAMNALGTSTILTAMPGTAGDGAYLLYISRSSQIPTSFTLRYWKGGFCSNCPAVGVSTNAYMYSSCPSGYWSAAGATTCTPAGLGYFSADINGLPTIGAGLQNIGRPAVQALQCACGTYAADATISFLCTECDTGAISSVGASACTPCPAGTYLDDSNGCSICTSCAAGKFSAVTSATSSTTCQPCGAGSYSLSGASSCTLCSSGHISTTSGATECIPCSPGKWVAIEGQASCIFCAPGKSGNSTGAVSLNSCAPCSAGSYQVDSGAIVCTLCLSGKYSTSVGSSVNSCIDCSKGKYNDQLGQTACDNCSKGKYNDQSGQAACVNCSSGKYSITIGDTDGSGCVDCSLGDFSDAGSTVCATCAAGKIACPTTGCSACTDCQPGKYTSLGGTTTCLNCPQGKFLATSGSTACQNCGPGSYNSQLAQSVCSNCIAGTFAIAIGAQNNSVCAICSPGLYSSVSASTSCDSCQEGTFSESAGSTACQACATGKSSTNEATTCYAPSSQPTGQPSSFPTYDFNSGAQFELEKKMNVVVEGNSTIFAMSTKYTNLGNTGQVYLLNFKFIAQYFGTDFFFSVEVNGVPVGVSCSPDSCLQKETICFANVPVQSKIITENGGTLNLRAYSSSIPPQANLPCASGASYPGFAFGTLTLTRDSFPTLVPTSPPTFPGNETNTIINESDGFAFDLNSLGLGSSVVMMLSFGGIMALVGIGITFNIRKKSDHLYRFPIVSTICAFGLEGADFFSEIFMLRVMFQFKQYYKQGIIILFSRAFNVVPTTYILFLLWGPQSFKKWKYGGDWYPLVDSEHLLKEQKIYLNLCVLAMIISCTYLHYMPFINNHFVHGSNGYPNLFGFRLIQLYNISHAAIKLMAQASYIIELRYKGGSKDGDQFTYISLVFSLIVFSISALEYFLKISGLSVLAEKCEVEEVLAKKNKALEEGDIDEYEKYANVDFTLLENNVKSALANAPGTDKENSTAIASHIMDAIIRERQKLEKERKTLQQERKDLAELHGITDGLGVQPQSERSFLRRASAFISAAVSAPPPPPLKSKKSKKKALSVFVEDEEEDDEEFTAGVKTSDGKGGVPHTSNPMLEMVETKKKDKYQDRPVSMREKDDDKDSEKELKKLKDKDRKKSEKRLGSRKSNSKEKESSSAPSRNNDPAEDNMDYGDIYGGGQDE